MSDFEKTDMNRVKRMPKRGQYDRKTVYEIVDAGLICHLGFVQAGRPFVIPTIHARVGDSIILHGASTSRMMKHSGNKVHPLCVTVTHLDGLVFARAAMNNSMNYRSAVLFGNGRLLEGDEKMEAAYAFTEKLMPGRWDDSRPPNENEMKATSIVAMDIDMASAKIRTGGPVDNEADYDLPYWSGVLPLTPQFGAPINDERLPEGIPVPDYVTNLKP